MIRTISTPLRGRGRMDLLDNVSCILAAAGIEAGGGRIESVARKVAVGPFRAPWEASWAGLDVLAATIIRFWHYRAMAARSDCYCSSERSDSFTIRFTLVI